MAEETSGSMKIPGIVLDADQKFKEGDVNFKTQDDGRVTGFGKPVSLAAGQKMINQSLAILRTAYHNASPDVKTEIDQRPVAITFGKEALLSILTQEGCEGIRFYFCINHNETPSIVACGVKVNPNAGNVEEPTLATLAKDLGSIDGSLTILETPVKVSSDPEDFFLYEVGPPTRFGELPADIHGLILTTFEEQLSKVVKKL